MNPIRPLVVIGAGPAGIMAALTAAARGAKVLLLEKKNELGGKIPVTGDGKGNLSNANLNAAHYHSQYPESVAPALQSFGFKETGEFFEKIGMKFYIDREGRVYPYSREAASIQKLLTAELERLKVETVTGVAIKGIRRIGANFEIIMEHVPSLYAQKVILATGGLAAPKLGSTGAGYNWAVQLGHQLEPLFPALVQLKTNLTEINFLNRLKLAKVTVTLLINDQLVKVKSGDLLFIPQGVSGTAIFSLSRCACFALLQGSKAAISINLTPDFNQTALLKLFKRQKKKFPGQTIQLLLQALLPERLSKFILHKLTIASNLTIGSATEQEMESIIVNIVNFNLPIMETASWKYAQITCGGIRMNEINPETMESKIVPHLYFAGEILDVDGDCGGYNLQWAWTSGYLAGKAAAEKVK